MTTMTTESIRIGALDIRFLVEAAQLDGAAAIFQFSVPAGARVPVPHSHDAYEETIYGVEGVLTWTIEGDAHDVAAGEVLVIPRGAVHGFANPGSVDAKALAVVTPGLLGPEYFREVGEAVAAGNLPEVGAIMQRHGLTPAP